MSARRAPVQLHAGTPTELGEALAPAGVIGPDAVVAALVTLPLPLTVVASDAALADPAAGTALPDGRRAFAVMAVHVPETDVPDQEDLPFKGGGVALEIESPALREPTLQHPARSFWCLFFPRLAVCTKQ